MEGRIFSALGDQPKTCEFFQTHKFKTFDKIIPTYQQYEDMIPSREINNKSSVKFKIVDMPDILEINNGFMQELVRLQPNDALFATDFISQILRYKWEHYA